jgi:hypothetical protein
MITQPTVTASVYGTELQTYAKMRDATDEFEVEGLHVPKVPGPVEMELRHKSCLSTIWVELLIDEKFRCEACHRNYQLASIYPLSIVEVPLVESRDDTRR